MKFSMFFRTERLNQVSSSRGNAYVHTVDGEFRFCGVADRAEVEAEYEIIQIVDALSAAIW